MNKQRITPHCSSRRLCTCTVVETLAIDDILKLIIQVGIEETKSHCLKFKMQNFIKNCASQSPDKYSPNDKSNYHYYHKVCVL